jgi:hypothetical protein
MHIHIQPLNRRTVHACFVFTGSYVTMGSHCSDEPQNTAGTVGTLVSSYAGGAKGATRVGCISSTTIPERTHLSARSAMPTALSRALPANTTRGVPVRCTALAHLLVHLKRTGVLKHAIYFPFAFSLSFATFELEKSRVVRQLLFGRQQQSCTRVPKRHPFTLHRTVKITPKDPVNYSVIHALGPVRKMKGQQMPHGMRIKIHK